MKQYLEANKDKIRDREKQYYEDNKEKIKEYQKRYREDNKEKAKQYREDNKEKAKQYYQDNKEKAKQYYQDNKEKIKEKIKQYYQDNKEKIRDREKQYRKTENGKIIMKLARQRRRARKMNLPNTLTQQEYENTLNFFHNSCANCGSKEDLHMDHFIPLSDEENCPGTTKSNIIPLCEDCNLTKHNTSPKKFFSKEKYIYIVTYLLRQKGLWLG